MVHNDVLGVVQVAGQRNHVRAGELVCAVDCFLFPISPEDSILDKGQKKKQKQKSFNAEQVYS